MLKNWPQWRTLIYNTKLLAKNIKSTSAQIKALLFSINQKTTTMSMTKSKRDQAMTSQTGYDAIIYRKILRGHLFGFHTLFCLDFLFELLWTAQPHFVFHFLGRFLYQWFERFRFLLYRVLCVPTRAYQGK